MATSTITLSDTALNSKETSTVTITFSQHVFTLDPSAVTADNGTITNLSSKDEGLTWTALYTPTGGVTSNTNVVRVNHASLPGGVATSANFVVDTAAPVFAISMSDTELAPGETSAVTITFGEAVTGLQNSNVTTPNGTLSPLASKDEGLTWTAVFTPTPGVSASGNVFSTDPTGVTDLAGNTATIPVTSGYYPTYNINTQGPSATILMSDSVLGIGETATVSIQFSDAVAGFTVDDLSALGGTVSKLSTADGGAGKDWVAIFTPDANTSLGGNKITLNAAGVTNAAGTATVSGSPASATYTVDTVAPVATVTMSDTDLRAGESATLTVKFSEAVSGMADGILSAPNGKLSTFVTNDEGLTWSATFTPDANLSVADNQIGIKLDGIKDVAGNVATTAPAGTPTYAINTLTGPTGTIGVNDTALRSGETAVVSIQFSEAVTGFTLADLSAENGVLSGLVTADEGIGKNWIAVFTPNAGVTDTSNQISLINAGVTNAGGAAVVGSVVSPNYAIDTAAPSATITLSDSALKAGETAQVTFTFSEAVTGFSGANVSVANGTLSALSSNDEGVGTSWSATFTPGANVTDATNLISLDFKGIADLAGNTAIGTVQSGNYTIDTLRPTASIVLSRDTFKAGESAQVTFNFSEAVIGLGAEDLTVANGTVTNLVAGDEGIGLTWTGTFTPNAGVESKANLITLDNAGVSDLAGNAGSATTPSANYVIDTKAPTATLSMSDTDIKRGETSVLTISFSEAVTGLTNEDLTVGNGTLSPVSTTDGGLTWTSVFTPTEGISQTNTQISLNSLGVTDLAGNAGTAGFVPSGYYSVDTMPPPDTQPPTASVAIGSALLGVGGTAAVTITFSEAVTGLTSEDLTVGSGAVTGLISTDGGVTWTGTLTPEAGVQTSGNVITLNNAGVADASHNAGVGTTTSATSYAVDTKAPSATIALSDSALKAGETAQVTITFSERVTGLTADDLTVANGTVSGLVSNDEGLTWTGTFTPAAGVTDTGNLITLNNAGVVDGAGNAGSGTTDSGNYTIDTQAPSATIALSDSALKAGETAQVTITFSERVGGLATDDLKVAHGAIAGLASADEGLTWTGTYTPASGTQAADATIVLDMAGVVDGAGNAGTGLTPSAAFAIDTKLPTATISISDSKLQVGETAVVTLSFSEAVTGLTLDDLVAQSGKLGPLASKDGGLTWTASFTPTADITDTSNTITLDNTGVADLAGNAGAGLTVSGNYTVDTFVPPPPRPTPILVDGAQVTKESAVGANGGAIQIVSVPVVTTTRTNTDGAATLADIPLVTAGDGRLVLGVGVPVGVGLQASGSASARGAQASLADLISAIQTHTAPGSQQQQSLVAGGTGFLGSLDPTAPLVVQTIVATAAGGTAAPGDALVIQGTAAAPGAPRTALVIDAAGMPGGSSIELQNVEFAAVIGNVRVSGGLGSQSVWGDNASQYIVLGEDDDVLHGGAGNDTVGSAGGNDQIFGDEGDDIVFGGLGDDLVDGGSGHDVVQLAGTGRADYSLRVSNGKLVMTHRDGGADGTDIVSNVEVLRFAGAGDVAFNTTDVASLVRLYDAAFDRKADEAGINYWIGQSEGGAVLKDIAAAMLGAQEALGLYGGVSNEAFVARLYASGLGRAGSAAEVQWWTERLDSGAATRGDTLIGFADSAEMVALVGVMSTSIETL